MKKSDQREVLIGIIFFMIGSVMCINIEKAHKLDNYRHEIIEAKLLDAYKWKKDRLRVYTGIIYNTKYKP